MDEGEKHAKAMDAYNKGDLEGAGEALGLQPVAKKFGHEFDETAESYDKRLRAALGLPAPATEEGTGSHLGAGGPVVVDPVEGGPVGSAGPVEGHVEHEDNPEPEDNDEHGHRSGRRHRK
jgi:hypothetical protein